MRIAKQITTAAAAAMLVAPVFAIAQQSPSQGGANAPSAEVQTLITEYREVANELQTIRENAIESNPELADKRDAFQGRVKTAMSESGYDVESNRERVQEIGQKLQGGDVEDGKKQKLVQELRTKQQEMREAQQVAMEKPEVQAAGQEFQQATLTAMRDQNADTDQLLDRMTEIRGKLQTMQQQQSDG